jgi:hypothetical protein
MSPLAKAARALVLKESGTDSFDALEPELQEQVIESVKAVLEAVRSPSDAMLEAGVDGAGNSAFEVENAWQAIIDAAIAEG